MKKISLLATVLLVASSLFATPTLKADRLSQKQFMASSQLAVKSTDALSVRKAPQQTAAGITYENGIILNANGEQLRVYNAAGQLVAESTRNIDMNTFAAGVYVVNAQQTTFKIAK